MSGRYIDTDKFKRDNEKLLHCDFPYLCEETLEELIDEQPTADVRKNVHGEWIEKGTNEDGTHNIVCSNCSHGYKSKGHAHSYNTKEKFKYCPHCGADMRKGETNDS